MHPILRAADLRKQQGLSAAVVYIALRLFRRVARKFPGAESTVTLISLLGVNAIYGAGIDAGSVLHPDAGLGNNVCHRPPPASKLCLAEGGFKRGRGKLPASWQSWWRKFRR